MTYDPKWEEISWFDEYNTLDGLRIMQREAGPENVRRYADLFIGEPRTRLLQCVSLMALVCGAGKTMAMVASMLVLNEVVNARIKNGPRCKKVLWFVKERLLATQLKQELEAEILSFNLHHTKPRVRICDETGDLEMGPLHHDITISCPHVIWDKENQLRSDEKIMEILAPFDTMIFDECDWASDQIERLSRLSAHALKFGLTAAPIDSDGIAMFKYFVLAGMATYQQVFERDKCLKRLIPWDEAIAGGFVKSISHDGYSFLDAGQERFQPGKHGKRHSLPGHMAAIRTAIIDCNDLEQEMQRAWPTQWYSPHILVECDNVSDADHLATQINDQIRSGQLQLIGHGWRALVMHEKLKTDQREEVRLFHRDKNIIHPFMRAKNNNGRCDAKSARILFVVNMAIRGMNNWPLLYLVDIKRSISVSLQVQFKGRDHRWPRQLINLVDNERFPHFCTGRYYFPSAGDEGSDGRMRDAYDYILNMGQKIESGGFLEWSHLLEGKSRTEMPDDPQPTDTPFTLGDRLTLDLKLGQLKKTGNPITKEDMEGMIDFLPGILSDKRKEKARQHMARVMDDPEYRSEFIKISEVEQITPISLERPKLAADYSLEELGSFVLSSEKWHHVAEDMIRQIAINSTMRTVVALEKRGLDQRLYHAVPKLLQLQEADGKPGILRTIGNQLVADFLTRGLIDRSMMGRVYQAVAEATCRATRMAIIKDSTKNDGPLDQPGYHHSFGLPHSQRIIKNVAVALLIRWGVLGDIARVYSDVIGEDESNAA